MKHTCGQSHRQVSQGFSKLGAGVYNIIEYKGREAFNLVPVKEKLYSAYLGNVEVELSKSKGVDSTCYLEANYTDAKTGRSILVKVIDAKRYKLDSDSEYDVGQLRELDAMQLNLEDNCYFYYVTLLSSRMIAVLENRIKDVEQIDVKIKQYVVDAKIVSRIQKEYPFLLQTAPVNTLAEYKAVYKRAIIKNSCVDVLFNIYNYVEFLNDKVGLWGVGGADHFVAIANVDNMDNAYWTGTYMVFGNGQSEFYPLTCLDVCGHEIGHGVVQQLAGLEYSKHSGALNESFADVIGTMFEFWMYSKYNAEGEDPRDDILGKADYLIGEDLAVSSVPLRSMEDPSKGMSPQPSVYKGKNYFNPNQQADNGGVHINSGIINYCWYLMAKATSRDVAFKQYMDCLRQLSPTNATFIDFRDTLKRVTNNDSKVLECLNKVGLGDGAESDIGGRGRSKQPPQQPPQQHAKVVCPYNHSQHIHDPILCPPLYQRPRYIGKPGARHPQCGYCNETYPLEYDVSTVSITGSSDGYVSLRYKNDTTEVNLTD